MCQYKIAMTIPITTATVERGFSKLLFIKNKLRSTMQQERLEVLMLASVEKDMLRPMVSGVQFCS
jgi:hypothetical protein